MTRTTFITTLAVLAILAGADRVAWSQETLKVAIPQRGACLRDQRCAQLTLFGSAWLVRMAGIELGQRSERCFNRAP